MTFLTVSLAHNDNNNKITVRDNITVQDQCTRSVFEISVRDQINARENDTRKTVLAYGSIRAKVWVWS